MKRASHVKMTERRFRASKRYWFGELKRAMGQFRAGNLYLPPFAFIQWKRLEGAMDAMERELKPWWRKV